jgi:diguanylate cyclase (GGDEF)-like protein
MAEQNKDVQDNLKSLQQGYIERLPEEMKMAEGFWTTVQKEVRDRDSLYALYRLIHRLNGSGTTFGFPEISKITSDMEAILQDIVDGEERPSEDQQHRIDEGLLALRGHVNHLLSVQDKAASTPTPSLSSEEMVTEIFMLEYDPIETADLKQQLRYFGYKVRSSPRIEEIRQSKSAPAVLIVDLDCFIDAPIAYEALMLIQRSHDTALPMITLSSRGDMADRLQAVRAGSSAYFIKPVEASQVVDMLDQLTHKRPSEPYRILIIDDDDRLANYYASSLRQAGMLTRIIQNPIEVLTALDDFRPDLVILDLYMPQCGGLELAAVIRQQRAYVSIPLVFLSTEANINHHLSALQLSGDDFLTKPIATQQLVASLTARVQRARVLRSFMVQDSLTGLFNHTTTIEHLHREFARAQRLQTPLTFAMIDIDRFKSVNDTYGHPTGDRVLKNLARLLQQRLRQTDIIGRYGGEEFAVILVGANAENAVRLMNEIRERFGQLRQQSEDAEFYVTLSCGIADIADYTMPLALSDAADKALYHAKRSGRNRVVLAGHEEG